MNTDTISFFKYKTKIYNITENCDFVQCGWLYIAYILLNLDLQTVINFSKIYIAENN